MSEAVAPVSGHDGTPEGVIVALKERPGEAAVTFFENLGMHSHILYNPDSESFDLEVHTTAVFPWDEEQVMVEEPGLSAEEVVIRLQILATRDEWDGRGEPVPEDVNVELMDRFQLISLAAMMGITLAELTGE